MNYWLMKSEPDCFSIDDLAARPKQTEAWDGVRNFQVRNMMRDQMAPGDQAFFYHSSCPQPGIVGVMNIVSRAYPDASQFDPKADHFDPTAKREEPRWLMVDVQFQAKFDKPVLLTDLRDKQAAFDGLRILEKGSRLSVTPVKPAHWKAILKLASA